MRDLAVAGILSIEPDKKAAVNSFKIQINSWRIDIFMVSKFSDVGSTGNILREIRRIKWKRVADVGVLVVVVSVVLPYAGYRNGIIIRQVTAGGIKWVL